ncbi:helix-turn-helix transcriptional regulator [Burkholderia glumae]|uniref:helix-turn-helix transcriptional regulator n=1 Tax=Burkholderia glumae TaxID=337 RepID=UPI0021501F66|nr:helix-turn-helix transcriptional regulator [Burkholderia glumae]
MNNVRQLRKSLGLSQFDLARGIGITQSALSHYENGSCDPLVDTARKLIAFAKGLGVEWTLDDVFSPPMVGAEAKEGA